jgi:CDP-diglyceride synthetase
MQTTQVDGGKGNWIAFLFGAIFNLLGSVTVTMIVDSAVQAVVGGIIVLLFKILGDYFDPQIKRIVAWLRSLRKDANENGIQK